MQYNVTRRKFLGATAATAAFAATGFSSIAAWRADAAEERGGGEVVSTPSMCNGCSSKCGLWANVVDGKLWTLEGNKDHPYSKGMLCGRGHGVAQFAYAEERITEPLHRLEDGTFEPVSWDDAFAAIGERIKAITAEHGAETIAIVQDPRPTGKTYSKMLIHALGSNNIYTHGASCNLSKEGGLTDTIGAAKYSIDFAKAKVVMFIGRSYGDGLRPSSVKSLADAAEGSARIIMVDPRLNNSCIFADDWLPIIPGTDIALLLAICNVLVANDLYDADFVEENTVGFEEFAEEVMRYTPEWAADICGISADRITEIAKAMAAAKPAAAVEPSWRAAFGCAHQNSYETARAVAAVNTLLGAWGAKGGALITSTPKAGKLDQEKFPSIPKVEAKRIGDADYPLVLDAMGSNVALLEHALAGDVHAMFFYNSNPVHGYSNPAKWREGLQKVDLKVCIDIQMSETALECDYVLPECTYLERTEVPEFIGGKKHLVAMRFQALDVIHPDTRPGDEIFVDIAKACGKGEYFPFTIDELSEAQLATVGTSMAEVREKGIVQLESSFEYGVPKFKTPSGKIELSSEKVGNAGLNPVIGYIPRKTWPEEGQFFFAGGKQSIHSHTMTRNIPSLNAISREYDMERVWVAASDAEKLGIKEGDMVELSNENYTAQAAAHVTERVRPGVLYMPTHYGGESTYLTLAYGYGVNPMQFVPLQAEPAVGSCMSQEFTLTLKKVEK